MTHSKLAHRTRSPATAEGPRDAVVTRYVSIFVLCFTSYRSYKGFRQKK